MGEGSRPRYSGVSATAPRSPVEPYDPDTIEDCDHSDQCHECQFPGWCIGEGPRSRVEDGAASTKEEIARLIVGTHRGESLSADEIIAKMRERLWTRYSSRKADNQ